MKRACKIYTPKVMIKMRVPPIAIGASYMIPLKIINFNHMKRAMMKHLTPRRNIILASSIPLTI
jgi:hypothetical protein